MNRKTLSHFSWWFAAIVLICIAGLAEQVFRHLLVFVLVAVVAAIGAYVLGHRHGRAGIRKAATRRLLDAQRLGQADELEALSSRSLDEMISSYRLIARRHGDDRR